MTTTATWQAQTTSPPRSRLGRFGSNWSFGRPSSSSQNRLRSQTIASHVPEETRRMQNGSVAAAEWSGTSITQRKLDKGKGRETAQVNSTESTSWDSLMDEVQMSDPFRNSRGSARGAHMLNYVFSGREDGSLQSHNNQSGSTSGHGHSDSYSGHPYGTAGAYGTLTSNAAVDDRGRPRSRAYSASAGALLTTPARPQASQSYVSEQPRQQHPFASALAMSGQSGRDRGDTFRAGAARQQPQPSSGKQTVISYASPDLNGVGIGASPVPAHRGHDAAARRGHQPARSQDSDHGFKLFSNSHHQQQKQAPAQPTQSSSTPRGSFSSFWTFGHASHSKGPGVSTARLSGESSSQSQSQSRPSTSAAAQYGSPSAVPPALHATSTNSVRPRANTTMEMLPAHASSELLSPVSHTAQLRRRSELSSGNMLAPNDPYEQLRGVVRNEVDIEPEDAEASYPSHPYATALPNKGHREFSTLLPADKARQRGKSKERRIPILNFTVPTKNSMNNLRSAASRGFLKSSVSTPNLRSADQQHRLQVVGSEKQGSSPNSPGFGAKWLSAETWCDALIFPRPRFRVRAAHVISPPESPVLGRNEKGSHGEALYRLNGGPDYSTPPYSAPVTTITRSDELYDNGLDRRADGVLVIPTSAPPLSSIPSEGAVDANKVGENSKSKLPEKSNPSRPPRPKSFALDDMALPSPAPSLLRVLKEREEFSKERDDWKLKASKSFQNKRSRSLSRSRAKALERRGRKISQEEDDELKTSFAFIAASAFLGHQTVRPSVSEPPQSSSVSKATNSVGINTISTHSRKSSGTSNAHATGYSGTKGHGRKESWGKTALKATTGLCTFGTDVSPVEEKSLNGVSQTRDHSKYAVLEDGQTAVNEKREAGRSGVLLIALYPKPPPQYAPQNRVNTQISPSPVPSSAESTSRSGVGIAVSTPTALLPLGQEEAFQFTSHPFATHYKEEIPHPSDYAGPHPSSAKAPAFNINDMNDLNSRHRRQPSAGTTAYSAPAPIVHPYATANDPSRPRPTIRLPVTGGLTVPVTTMFAQVGNGDIREVLPDEFQYSPYSRNPSSSGSSSRNSDALGVEEALSVAFSRAGLSDREKSSGDEAKEVFPVVEDDDEDDDDSNFQRDENDTGVSVAAAQIVTAMSAVKSPAELRHNVMPRVDEMSPFVSPTSEAHDNGWRTSVNGHIVRQESIGSQRSPFYAPIFKQESSSPGLSLDSSPMASPRQISSMEEEDYQDLFYRPGMQSAGNSIRRTPSSELVKSLSSRTPSGSDPPKVFSRPTVAKTASTGSALSNLTRQLSEEYSSQLDDERQTFGVMNDSPRSHHFIDVEERDDDELPLGETDELVFDTGRDESVSVNISGIRHASTDPSLIIPEDVESEAALSLDGHDETVEGAEIMYRLGEVSTLATPNPTQDGVEHRFSTHGSYFEHEDQHAEDIELERQRTQSAHHSHQSLQPPLSAAVTENTRSSYVTSTSSASRISQLSDFPVPPPLAHDAVSPGQIIQSYFSPSTQKEDPLDFPSSQYHDDPTEMGHSTEVGHEEHDEPTVTVPRTRNRSTTFGVEEVPDLHQP